MNRIAKLEDQLFGGKRWMPFRRLGMVRRVMVSALACPEHYWEDGADSLLAETKRVYRANYGSILVVIAIMGIIINVLVQWWLHRTEQGCAASEELGWLGAEALTELRRHAQERRSR